MGAVAVDQLLTYWADPPVWPVSLAQLDDPALETLQSKLRIQAWILALTMPVNAATVARLPAIRQLLAQAGVLGKAASIKNCPFPVAQAAPDCRAFQSELEDLAFNAARPLRAEAPFSVHEPIRSANPCPGDWQAVPA